MTCRPPADDNASFKEMYRRYILKKIAFVVVCVAASVACAGFELAAGSYGIGFKEALSIISDHLSGNLPTDTWELVKHNIVWEDRLPRTIAAFAVGITLGVCGAAMQSSMRNPLADPYTTGISSGASLGATVSIILGWSVLPGLFGNSALVINAFVFSLIPATIIIVISMFKRNVSPTTMILIGIAVMYLFTAVTTFLKLTASEEELARIYMWNVGSIGSASWGNVGLMCLAAAIGLVSIQCMSRKLNLLAMSDPCAVSLGMDPKRVRLAGLVIVSFVTAVIVSFTGTIGFVGLVAPHVARMFLGSDNRYLVPASAAFGAVLMLVSDVVAKNIGTGLPVGAITAVIGGPLFILLLMKQQRSAW